MEEIKEKGIKLNLIAIIIAFIFGLTIGQIDFKEMLEPGGEFKSRESTSAISVESSANNPELLVSTEKATQSTLLNQTAAVTNKNAEYGELVYRTPTGKRYHLDSYCAGVNYIESTVEESTALGLTPCKKCAGG